MQVSHHACGFPGVAGHSQDMLSGGQAIEVMRRNLFISALAIPALLACGDLQSIFRAGSSESAQVAELAQVMFIGGGVIFTFVMLLAGASLFGPESLRAALGQHRFILAGGVAFPVVVLSTLLVYSLLPAAALVRADEPDLRIEVVGELWWWRVRYIDNAGASVVELANEIRIPTGRTVELGLSTADVIHSFWVPGLAGKIDMIPGRVNKKTLRAAEPGVFRGQCAEYCGAQHANMALYVVALKPDEFDAWLAAQTRPANLPSEPLTLTGREAFFANDCSRCHTIRGTAAAGSEGPDLTHAGSRLSLAAGLLPNTVGAFGGWIAGSAHLKPGNRMPSFDGLSSDELRALAAYMESLQ